MENIYFIQKPNIPSIHHHPSFLLLSFPTQSKLSSMDPLSTHPLANNPKVWPNPEVRWTWEEEMGCSLDTKPFPCSLSGILIRQCIHVRGLTPNVLTLVLSLQVFEPTRFAPGSTRHSHAFLPFSGGSR